MTGPWTAEDIAADQDVRDARALVTGTLLGLLTRYVADPDRPVRIEQVQMVDDMHGNHQPMVRLRMRSGAKLLLIVAEDT